jgi:hypothetical protein
MSDMSFSKTVAEAGEDSAVAVVAPVRVEAEPAGCSFPNDPVARRRAMMLLLHADFALFQPGGVCAKARTVNV